MEDDKTLIDTKSSSLSKSPLTSIWNLQNNSLNEALKVSSLYKTSHGMFAGVPIICKNDKCHYKDVCLIEEQNRIIGQRCPMEMGAIMARFEMWCGHFGVDISKGYVKEQDLVDASLIRDIVDFEIQILRAENKIAISGDFIGKVVSTVDKTGRPFYTDEVTPEAQFKLQLQEKKNKTFNLLNSTRKDKASELKKDNHPSVRASGLLKKIDMLLDKEVEENIVEVQIKEE